jgi:hypothetical protein
VFRHHVAMIGDDSAHARDDVDRHGSDEERIANT